MQNPVKYIKAILVVLTWYMATDASYAQSLSVGLISGAVKSVDGELLPLAQLQIQETSQGVVSDTNGQFTFDRIPFGEYQIKASFVGYESAVQFVSIDQNNSAVSISFSLIKDSRMLDEVTVTHDVEEEKQVLGFAVEAIGTRQFQTQSIELNKVLDQTAGVRVRESGGLGSRVNYSMNGLSGQSIRFFMDGVPMDYFGTSYSINTIPISLIDRVEMYKGVVPVELGNDALGGAINLVTRTNLNDYLEASYSYGSFNTHRASLQGSWRAENTGLTLKISSFYNYSDNDYEVWGKDIFVTDPCTFEVTRGMKVRRFHDGYESKAVKTDVGFTQKKWADKLLLGMLYSDMDREIQHGPTMEVPFGQANYGQQVMMPHLTYQKFGFLVTGLDVNLFTSYSHLERNRVDTTRNIYNWHGQVEGQRTLGGEQIRTLNSLTQNVFLNRINLVYQLNDQHKVGYNYVYSSLTRTDRDPLVTQKTEGYYSPQVLKKHSMGWVLQSEMLDKRLNTSLFVKWFGYNAEIKTSETQEGVTSYATELTDASSIGYGLAGSYQVLSYLMLNGSLERAYRLPEANEILGDGLNVISTTELRPESSLNANFGFRLNLLEERASRFIVSGSLFYRDVTDLIQQYSYDPGAFVYINFDKVRMQGLDGKVRFIHQDWLTINQTISYLNPIVKSDTDELGNSNVIENTRLANTPFFQTNTDVRFTFKNLFQGNSQSFIYWNMSYVGEFHRHSEIIGEFNKDVIPTQWLNSCGMGYTFPKEELSLSIDMSNLFNEQIFDNYAIQKPGRAAYVKVTYRIL